MGVDSETSETISLSPGVVSVYNGKHLPTDKILTSASIQIKPGETVVGTPTAELYLTQDSSKILKLGDADAIGPNTAFTWQGQVKLEAGKTYRIDAYLLSSDAEAFKIILGWGFK